MELNYYKILDVPQNASSNEIKRAYRLKSKLLHPDKNNSPNAKILFQLLNEAYRTLINPEKRRWYDFKLQYPSTTNINQSNKKRPTSSYESYFKAYQFRQQQKQEEKEFIKYRKTFLDKVLFYFLILTGILAIIFSILDLVYVKVDIKNMSGIFFGVWFLLIMFWGWNTMSKR